LFKTHRAVRQGGLGAERSGVTTLPLPTQRSRAF
jgi:hypothetical protein